MKVGNEGNEKPGKYSKRIKNNHFSIEKHVNLTYLSWRQPIFHHIILKFFNFPNSEFFKFLIASLISVAVLDLATFRIIDNMSFFQSEHALAVFVSKRSQVCSR